VHPDLRLNARPSLEAIMSKSKKQQKKRQRRASDYIRQQYEAGFPTPTVRQLTVHLGGIQSDAAFGAAARAVRLSRNELQNMGEQAIQ